MSETAQNLLVELLKHVHYYFVGEASKETGKDVISIQIDNINYFKTSGRFGEVFVVDVFYSSEFGEHKTKVAIKFVEKASEAIIEIKNTALLEQKFAARSVVKIPRYIFVNLSSQPFIVYEGMTGVNYEDAMNVNDKSFWAGYVLSIIHGGKAKPVIADVYEEIFRRLVLAIYGGDNREQEIMEKSKNLLNMISVSQGGCDAFGDFHQSNLMLRTTTENEVVSIALIDPTFWMKGAYDRWEDVGTFFGRQTMVQYRQTESFADMIDDVKNFILGYNVHLKEINAPTLYDIYPKGFPLDFYIAIWAMMDYVEKTVNQNVSHQHPDILLLKQVGYRLLTEQPINEALNK